MSHPDRIQVETRPRRWRLPAMGWAAVYTLGAIGAGAMFYFIRR